MAIQPANRPAGSSHVLRFMGPLIEQVAAGVQVVNGEVPQGAVADAATTVKFALADMTALTNLQRRLPSSAYDDSQPAGGSPHVNTGNNGPSVPLPPLVGVPQGKTYAQNIRVRAQELTATAANPNIARIDELFPFIQIDGAVGTGLGLEQNTGIPVLCLRIFFTADGIFQLSQGNQSSIRIAIEVEVPDTTLR